MAGLIWGTTDFYTTYGFTIAKGGVTVYAAPVRRNTIPIPGIDGELYQGIEMLPRPIIVRGFIQGSSQTDMYTKFFGLEAELIGSFSSAAPNYLAPSRPEKTLTIPNFGGKKFATCSYDGMEIDYPGSRLLTHMCALVIRFVQSHPSADPV